jgi:hypothetical protein
MAIYRSESGRRDRSLSGKARKKDEGGRWKNDSGLSPSPFWLTRATKVVRYPRDSLIYGR